MKKWDNLTEEDFDGLKVPGPSPTSYESARAEQLAMPKDMYLSEAAVEANDNEEELISQAPAALLRRDEGSKDLTFPKKILTMLAPGLLS